ncbi:MAG: carbohydrate binding family 9 domain-containing protein [Acidobacteria bacterium]|nr:carbohydrate binding family 9 domain-containing protein [Acidobacteriota bacterium]
MSAQPQQHDHGQPPAQVTAPERPAAGNRGEQYRIQPLRAARAPEIDGVLADEAWRTAPMIDTFTQQEPVNGQPATERTEVRVLYDSGNLYIAVHAFDSDPEHLTATEMRRDSDRINDEDYFQVILDTFRDSRSGYMFVTNPLGAKLEQQIFEEGGGNVRGSASNINKDWNGVWDAAARRTSDGWVAEIAIPMVTLRSPDVPVQTWGINFARQIRRKNEIVYWSPIPKPYNIMQVSLAGTITGMTDLNRGLDLRIKPYVTAGTKYDRVGEASTTDGLKDVGFDVKYGVGHGLALDVTVNTDFAQAEVDEQQVNLTRFQLFFPEKRDFFLENSGQFNVGTQGLERLMDLFFSRRIGLSDAGQPIGIRGGARLTGKVSGNNVALMDLQTEEFNGRPADNFLVARYSKDIRRRSKLGGLFINKESMNSPRFNRVAAADALFAPNRAFSIHTIAAKSMSPNVTTENNAYHARALYLDTKWQTYAEFSQIDRNFNDEVGFIPRTGIRQSKVHIERNPRPGGLIRVMEPMMNIIYITDTNNRLLTRRIHHMVGTRFQNGAYLNVWWNRWFDQIDEPFKVQTVTIPRGTYRYNELMFMFNSNPARKIYEQFSYSPQTYYGGNRTDISGTLGVRLSSRASGQYSLQRNDVSGPWGNFVVNLSIVRLDFAISPRQTVRSLSQYNSLTRQLSLSFRYNFIYKPGSDIYVTYDELQTDTLGRPIGRNRQFVVKTTYLLSR